MLLRVALLNIGFLWAPVFLIAEQLPHSCEERIQEIEKETYNIIDEMFARARTCAVDKEDMINFEWFIHSNIDGIQNILSDMRIESSFNPDVLNSLSKRKDAYLQEKIRYEFDRAVDGGADRASMRQFLTVSKILCDLSEGSNCKRLISTIKIEKREVLSLLRREEKACRAAQRLALERFVLGVRQRD